MDDFFTPREIEISSSHTGRLQREKGKRLRRMVILLASSLIALVVISLSAWAISRTMFPATTSAAKKPAQSRDKVAVKSEKAYFGNQKTRNDKVKTVAEGAEESEKPKEQVAVKNAINLLIIGFEEKGGHKKARGLLLAKLNLQNRNIQAINIPERLYLNIPGLGLDTISESYTMGSNSTQKTVEDFLQVPVENHIVMPYSDFEYLVNENRFKIAFDKAVETGFFADEKNAYRHEVAGIDVSKVDIISLPVKCVNISGEPYYEPDNEEVNRLVAALWGIKREVNTEITRVMILNGSGLPGVGREISQKLTANGFMVSDVKNASSFNYKNTQIVVYKEGFKQKAMTIQQILGIGSVAEHLVAQDVAEIAIIVGKDYGSIN